MAGGGGGGSGSGGGREPNGGGHHGLLMQELVTNDESITSDLFNDLIDDLLREVTFELHRKAKMGLLCFRCEDRYPSTIMEKNGYDIFGNAVSSKVITGEVRFNCLHCGRAVVASRYAPHLEKCMGIGRMARNSSRIASMRMQAFQEDVFYPNEPPSSYFTNTSLDEENDEDEDDDDATYGESASHRAIPDLESTPTLDDFHNSESDAPSSYSSKHARQAAVSGAGHDFSIKGKGGSRKPPKKKGRTATTEDSLINFGGGMDKEDSAPSVDKQKVDAHRASLSHVEENNLKWKSELATTKSKRSK